MSEMEGEFKMRLCKAGIPPEIRRGVGYRDSPHTQQGPGLPYLTTVFWCPEQCGLKGLSLKAAECVALTEDITESQHTHWSPASPGRQEPSCAPSHLCIWCLAKPAPRQRSAALCEGRRVWPSFRRPVATSGSHVQRACWPCCCSL